MHSQWGEVSGLEGGEDLQRHYGHSRGWTSCAGHGSPAGSERAQFHGVSWFWEERQCFAVAESHAYLLWGAPSWEGCFFHIKNLAACQGQGSSSLSRSKKAHWQVAVALALTLGDISVQRKEGMCTWKTLTSSPVFWVHQAQRGGCPQRGEKLDQGKADKENFRASQNTKLRN